ncbi:MAG: hypothetical protein HF967_04750 [Methanosarcinales archaeon]|nr:hypothetical protein [Methanosarcinales archaeon]
MNNIKVINNDTVENKHYTNHSQNENSYIVINDETDNEYIDYLLLNVDIHDYKRDKYINEAAPDLDYINGFLYIKDCYNIDEINNFLIKNSKYFTSDLKSDIKALYEAILKEIERLEQSHKLYSEEYYKELFIL